MSMREACGILRGMENVGHEVSMYRGQFRSQTESRIAMAAFSIVDGGRSRDGDVRNLISDAWDKQDCATHMPTDWIKIQVGEKIKWIPVVLRDFKGDS